jgi:hypothetical protein
VSSAGMNGSAESNPLVRMNDLEDAVRFMAPMYRNWEPNGTPLPGSAHIPRPNITINNYNGQQKAWKRVKRQRPNDNANQPTVKALQDVIQMSYGDGHETFDRADFELGEPLRKRIKTALEPFSSTWEDRIRALE